MRGGPPGMMTYLEKTQRPVGQRITIQGRYYTATTRYILKYGRVPAAISIPENSFCTNSVYNSNNRFRKNYCVSKKMK